MSNRASIPEVDIEKAMYACPRAPEKMPSRVRIVPGIITKPGGNTGVKGVRGC
jgi:hypothetical protein